MSFTISIAFISVSAILSIRNLHIKYSADIGSQRQPFADHAQVAEPDGSLLRNGAANRSPAWVCGVSVRGRQ